MNFRKILERGAPAPLFNTVARALIHP